MLVNLTSYDNATVGSGALVNQVQQAYNAFAQLVSSAQEHGGAVSGSSPTVGLSDANGSANTVRPTGMDYPSGRSLTYGYGSSGGISDHASRIAALIDNDGTTRLADYSFLGLGAIAGGPGCESSRYRGDEAEGGKVRQSRPIGLLPLRDPGSRRNGNRGHPPPAQSRQSSTAGVQ